MGGDDAACRIYHQIGRRIFDQPLGIGLDRRSAEQDGTWERIDAVTLPGCREPKITHGIIVKSMIRLLSMGKPD